MLVIISENLSTKDHVSSSGFSKSLGNTFLFLSENLEENNVNMTHQKFNIP